MGQKLFSENIEQLVVATTTTLTQAASIINVGGQQYISTSAITLDFGTTGVNGLDTGSITADTSYNIFAVNDGTGALGLIASTSAAPSGFTNYKQIGGTTTNSSSELVDAILTTKDRHTVTLTPSGNIDYLLPNNVSLGATVSVINAGALATGNTNVISIKAADGSIVRRVYPQTTGKVVATTDNPADNTGWKGVGAVVSEWQLYTQTYSGGTAPALSVDKAWWRRVGDTLEKRVVQYNTSGSPGSGGILTIDMELGMANADFDTSKYHQGSNFNAYGSGWLSGEFIISIGSNSSNNPIILKQNGAGFTGADFVDLDQLQYHFAIPIVGWETNGDTQ